MRWIFGWMMVAVLCGACTAAGKLGGEQPDARLVQAQTDFDEATKLRDAGSYPEATEKAEQALSLRRTVLGESHPEVARCLQLLGALSWRQGDFAHAEPLLQRALQLREAALGPHHLDVAESLNTLANLYFVQGLHEKAEPLYLRSLSIREATLGAHHPDVAGSLNNLAMLYQEQGLYEKAELLLQRTLSIAEATLGENHPDTAGSLLNLANLYLVQGMYEKAEPLYQRAHPILEASLGEHHPDIAVLLNNLATLYRGKGLYEKAEPLLQRALSILKATLGENHPQVATAANNLAELYKDQGLYEKAEPLQQRALAMREATLGKNHPDVAYSLSCLANLYKEQGLYEKAEPLYQRALSMREATLGENHPQVASSFNDLAVLYQQQGLYEKAEPLYQRALALQEAILRENHPGAANSLNNLATLYQQQGLYEKAEPLYQRALAMYEISYGKNHPIVANDLNNLGTLYREQGMYEKAEPLYQRALAIRETALGPHHSDVANSLDELATLYVMQGMYEKAEPLHQRALSILEASFGSHHPLVATSLYHLASLYQAQGSYEKAEPLQQRAFAVREAILGKNHPDVATSLQALGLLGVARHRLEDALPLLSRAFSISERRLRQEALDFSESRLATFLHYLHQNELDLYTLVRAYPRDARVRRLALSAVLLLKGRSIEETANISRALWQHLGASGRATLERLRGLRTQQASLSFSGPGSLTPQAYQQRLKALADEGDALEADLARLSAPLRARTALPPPEQIVERVAASLPKDAALVEFVASADSSDAPRYLALVLFPDASTRAVDLGPAAPVDLAAARLRDLLADRTDSFQAPARELYQRVFQPLLPLLGSTRRLLLAPEGQLSLVPFAALHDGQRFLVDAFDFTYLDSGRELLSRPEQGLAAASSVVVLADPDFSAASSARLSASRDAEQGTSRSSAVLERFFSTARATLSASDWESLPGTRQEAHDIQRLLPQAQLFLGPQATKERLLQVSTPGILHLATHGFFLNDTSASSSEDARAVSHFGGLTETPLAVHSPEPLLRSGLVLAGASVQSATPSGSRPDASLITALELAGLNLWGTQLVVLSACDTGRGDVRPGQGVYGLRRALVEAGAETVVMSLWKVKDDSTRQLMEAYYRQLLAGQGRASALSQAMRALRATHPHPHDWAPFIAVGSNAPLRALTPVPPR